MIYHEHTSYHHLKPLDKLFKKYNLKLNSVSEIPTHGGSMRIVLNNYIKNMILFENEKKSRNFINSDNQFDAEISRKHANFIINNSKATAEDIESLILYIQDIVFKKLNIKLETEVKFLGDKIYE